MHTIVPHAWDVLPQEALQIQERLRDRVVKRSCFSSLQTIGGADVSYKPDGAYARAVVVVLSYPDLCLLEAAVVHVPTSYPYIPGLLSFREAPSVLQALDKLEKLPDLLFCDGHGLAHPHRFGLACHIGVLSDLPSIGVAKSRLVGQYGSLAHERGSWQPVVDGNEEVGAALRTRSGLRPLFVSIGHRISLADAISLTLHCAPRFRLPEPIRQAHHLASKNDPDDKEFL